MEYLRINVIQNKIKDCENLRKNIIGNKIRDVEYFRIESEKIEIESEKKWWGMGYI